MPLKPDRRPTSIAFGKDGRVRVVEKQLPRVQKQLELTIGAHFAGSLEHFRQIKLGGIGPVDTQGDFCCSLEDGRPVCVQVVEVVDNRARILHERRKEYAAWLEMQVRDDEALFGCLLTIVDGSDAWKLSTIDRSDGATSAAELLRLVRSVPAARLDVSKCWCQKGLLEESGVEIAFWVDRSLPCGNTTPARVRWSGSEPIGAEACTPLLDAIRGKISRQYQKPSSEFWLLAYGFDVLADPTNPHIIGSAEFLRTTAPSFNQVWYMFPLAVADKELGWLVRLFPADDTIPRTDPNPKRVILGTWSAKEAIVE